MRAMHKAIDLTVNVQAEWDGEAEVWVATSDDVPGLVVQHADFSRLQEMVLELVPLLLAENHMLPDHDADFDVPVQIAAHALSKARARIAA